VIACSAVHYIRAMALLFDSAPCLWAKAWHLCPSRAAPAGFPFGGSRPAFLIRGQAAACCSCVVTAAGVVATVARGRPQARRLRIQLGRRLMPRG
jgi:hypothetical protein